MNKILRAILGGVEKVAAASNPIIGLADQAVHSTVDSIKDGQSKESAIFEGVMKELQLIEGFKPELVSDPIAFNNHLIVAHNELVAAYKLVKHPEAAGV